MQRAPISILAGHGDEPVRVCGFVNGIRVLKRMIFIVVEDRTGSVQVTIERASPSPPLERLALDVSLGAAVVIHGTAISNPAVRAGGVEILPSSIEIVGPSEGELPIHDDTAPERQLDWRFLSLRRPSRRLVFEVQTTVERAMRAYWEQHDFLELHSPKLMHSASESGSETFATPYFDLGTAYLAQSPQFYKQMAMAAGFERVFEIGPVFRAEPSMTTKHATEFTSVDVELAWIESHEDVMRLQEEWLRHLDFFRYGCPPHGGFGLGLARVIMQLLELPSVREAVFLHRGPNRLTP